ncbi:MarR family transcriptional regulator [Deinococcus sp.]|uniref:MarR family winged helix-turn-helix transcriptional regulator n=1 Tax=Deinococcus sp. TaxID=47478 RepID=UPI0025D2A497|nr:MarR family transcriptional regulator [Deinococcus sp.]
MTSPSSSITTPEHQLYLALQTLASDLSQQPTELLRATGLSTAQFNVLRILRGAGAGLTCGEIGGRLIARDPDVTRLLDRLEHAGLVARTRERRDRRVVTSRISEAGLKLLASLDAPLSRLHAAQFAHLPPEKLELLLTLLREIPPRNREAAPESRETE